MCDYITQYGVRVEGKLKSANRCILLVAVTAMAVGAASCAHAAVFYNETFNSSPAGWTVSGFPGGGGWTGGSGDPAGSLQGAFLSSIFPQTGTFATTSPNFTGNYNALSGSLSFTFDFYSSVTPASQIMFQMHGTDGDVFQLAVTPPAAGSWYLLTVPLDFSAGWSGAGGATGFSNVLADVSSVDLQVLRHGSSSQSYGIDNFQLLGNTAIFVPEPTSGLFWFGWALVFGGLRKKIAARRNRSPYALTPTR